MPPPIDIGPAPELWLPPRPAIIRPAPDLWRPPEGLLLASFLPGMFPAGAIAAEGYPVATATYRNQAVNNSAHTTLSASTVAIGTAELNRLVIAASCIEGFQGISDLTIGGVSATPVDDVAFGSERIYVYARNVTSGTTATCTSTYPASINKEVLLVWTVVPGRDLSIVTGTPYAATNTNIPTTGIAAEAGGIVLAIARGDVVTSFDTWTGVTERYDGNRVGTGEASIVATGTHNVSVTITGSSDDRIMILLAFR